MQSCYHFNLATTASSETPVQSSSVLQPLMYKAYSFLLHHHDILQWMSSDHSGYISQMFLKSPKQKRNMWRKRKKAINILDKLPGENIPEGKTENSWHEIYISLNVLHCPSQTFPTKTSRMALSLLGRQLHSILLHANLRVWCVCVRVEGGRVGCSTCLWVCALFDCWFQLSGDLCNPKAILVKFLWFRKG